MTRKSIFMILAGFILMSGCTSYSGVGIADNGKPYYFDDKCVKYVSSPSPQKVKNSTPMV